MQSGFPCSPHPSLKWGQGTAQFLQNTAIQMLMVSPLAPSHCGLYTRGKPLFLFGKKRGCRNTCQYPGFSVACMYSLLQARIRIWRRCTLEFHFVLWFSSLSLLFIFFFLIFKAVPMIGRFSKLWHKKFCSVKCCCCPIHRCVCVFFLFCLLVGLRNSV